MGNVKGGMKAVIWSDVVQASFMFIGLIFSITFGKKNLKKVSSGKRDLISKKRFDRCWWNWKCDQCIKKWKSTEFLCVRIIEIDRKKMNSYFVLV